MKSGPSGRSSFVTKLKSRGDGCVRLGILVVRYSNTFSDATTAQFTNGKIFPILGHKL
jgi:hypothetical protein